MKAHGSRHGSGPLNLKDYSDLVRAVKKFGVTRCCDCHLSLNHLEATFY